MSGESAVLGGRGAMEGPQGPEDPVRNFLGSVGSDDIVEMSQMCPELASVTFMTDPSSGPVVLRGEW